MKTKFVQITIVTEDDDYYCDKNCPYVRGAYCVLTKEPLDLTLPHPQNPYEMIRRQRTEFCKNHACCPVGTTNAITPGKDGEYYIHNGITDTVLEKFTLEKGKDNAKSKE